MVVGAVADVPQVFPFLRPDQATAILVDWPALSPDLARQLRAVAPDAGLIFLVGSYELSDIIPLLQAGVNGCVARDDTVGDLARAVIAAGRGEIVLPPTIAARALAALARGSLATDPLTEPLSDRETEVLHLLAHGYTNKDIAQALLISVRTVEAHLRSIYGKLNVRSRTEAVLWAVRRGYGPQDR
jgi:DNA-binding NarL/FixJ family response regulator